MMNLKYLSKKGISQLSKSVGEYLFYLGLFMEGNKD